MTENESSNLSEKNKLEEFENFNKKENNNDAQN